MFGNKTVATVMSGFTKTIKDLEAIKASSESQAIKITEEIAYMQNSKQACITEAAQAKAFAANISKMINGE